MLASSQNNSVLSTMRWLGVPIGALVGAGSALIVGAVVFPAIIPFMALAEGQWWGYEFKPGPIEFIWSLLLFYAYYIFFTRFTPIYGVMGGISGFLGGAVGFLSRRGEYAVLAGVISGLIVSPLIAAKEANNLGGLSMWFMFVGGLGGVLGALAGWVAFDRGNGRPERPHGVVKWTLKR